MAEILCSRQFLKQILQLKKAGGKAALAVKQAEIIASHLNSSNATSYFLRSKQTNSGEKRLKKIEKYDLGSGYRLVCSRNDTSFSFEFIGTHDKTDLWINSCRKAKTPRTTYVYQHVECTLPAVYRNSSPEKQPEINEKTDIYEEELRKRLDDKLLRQIFCGFVTESISEISRT